MPRQTLNIATAYISGSGLNNNAMIVNTAAADK
jgi:hypothetical protein